MEYNEQTRSHDTEMTDADTQSNPFQGSEPSRCSDPKSDSLEPQPVAEANATPVSPKKPRETREVTGRGAKQIPQTVWAGACEEYVAGRLPTLRDVARQLGLTPEHVLSHARRHGWTGLRRLRAKQLITEIEQGKVGQSVFKPIDPSTLRDAQASIAALALAHATEMMTLLNGSLADLKRTRDSLVSLGPDAVQNGSLGMRLGLLTSHHVTMLEQVRILSGISDPDKVPVAPKSTVQAAGNKQRRDQAPAPRLPSSILPRSVVVIPPAPTEPLTESEGDAIFLHTPEH